MLSTSATALASSMSGWSSGATSSCRWRVLIADGLIALRVGKLLHIPQVQPHREISPVRPLHLGKHLAHQFLPEGGQFLGLIGQILKLVDDLGQLLRVGELVDGALGVGYIV